MEEQPTASRKLAVTIYDNAKNTNGKAANGTFAQLLTVFSTREIRVAKDGKAFSPYRLKPGTTRGNANVAYASMAVADIDDGTTLDALRDKIAGYRWIAYSSHSHTTTHHKYRLVFPLARDVEPEEWAAFRARFEALLGGHSDPATKDIARFYYLPSCPPETSDAAFWEANEGTLLSPDTYGEGFDLDFNAPAPLMAMPLVNEFAGPRGEFPPSTLEQAAGLCKQLGDLRDGVILPEPVWYAILNVAQHCTDGPALAHTWSKQDPRYDPGVTSKKLTQGRGPTTCARFKVLNPAACVGCKIDTKVTSPIQAGYSVETKVPVMVLEEGKPAQEIAGWPQNYGTNTNNDLTYSFMNDGIMDTTIVATPFYRLTERIELIDGTFTLKAQMPTRNGKWREFEVLSKHSADPRGLAMHLASFEIAVNNEKLMQKYQREFATNLFRTRDEIKTYTQFGWRKDFDGFLIGDSLITKTERVKVRVSRDHVADDALLKAGAIRGSKEEWTDGVMELYDRPFGEPYQLAIFAQFGSPLVELMESDEWSGIPLALTSKQTGIGKSTVVKIGINALCKSSATTVADSTTAAIIGRASIMNNLPVLIDEVTQSLNDPELLVRALYTLFQGRARIGMDKSGRERTPLAPYKQVMTFTGNENLWAKIAMAKASSPEAIQMRLFEIDMDDYPTMDTVRKESPNHPRHHAIAAHLVDSVSGVWADEYFRYIMANREDVVTRLRSTASALIQLLGGHAAKERFFINFLACTLVGAWVSRKIGAHKFDIKAVKDWALLHLERLRTVATERVYSTEDNLSRLLADLHGHILVSKQYDSLDTRRGITEVPMLQLRGEIKARLVLGDQKERGKLYIAVSAIDDWCAQNKISAPSFRRTLAQSGALRTDPLTQSYDHRIRLGKGVPSHPLGQCRCYEVDFAAAQGYVEEYVAKDNVLPMAQRTAPTAAPDWGKDYLPGHTPD